MLHRRSALRSLPLAVACAACACGDPPAVTSPSPPGGVGQVAGRVMDAGKNDAAVGNATVMVTGTTIPLVREVTTAPDGSFAVSLPAGRYTVFVNGTPEGSLVATTAPSRGDVLIDTSGDCNTRYGVVYDRATMRPVNGAIVWLTRTPIVTGVDGWYRSDFGCAGPLFGNTAFMSIEHPAYAPRQAVIGRGQAGVTRIDVDLERR